MRVVPYLRSFARQASVPRNGNSSMAHPARASRSGRSPSAGEHNPGERTAPPDPFPAPGALLPDPRPEQRTATCDTPGVSLMGHMNGSPSLFMKGNLPWRDACSLRSLAASPACSRLNERGKPPGGIESRVRPDPINGAMPLTARRNRGGSRFDTGESLA